nr:hypothetical protein CFP56_26118 [Quercus suber]
MVTTHRVSALAHLVLCARDETTRRTFCKWDVFTDARRMSEAGKVSILYRAEFVTSDIGCSTCGKRQKSKTSPGLLRNHCFQGKHHDNNSQTPQLQAALRCSHDLFFNLDC